MLPSQKSKWRLIIHYKTRRHLGLSRHLDFFSLATLFLFLFSISFSSMIKILVYFYSAGDKQADSYESKDSKIILFFAVGSRWIIFLLNISFLNEKSLLFQKHT
jgi:hypothetical protein